MLRNPRDRAGSAHAARVPCATRARNVSSRLTWPAPALRRNSSSVPSAIRPPPEITPMRSAMRSGTSKMCVVMITEHPVSTRSRSTPLTKRAEPASRPVNGSSPVKMPGAWSSGPGLAPFWARTIEKDLAALRGVGFQTKPLDEIVRARLGEIARDPPQSGDEIEIFYWRQLVVDHRLVGKPGRHPLGGDGIDQSVDAVDLDRPVIGLEQPTHHPQCRRLACSIRPQQRVELASRHVEVYPIDCRALETLGEAANFQGERRRGGAHCFRRQEGWPGMRMEGKNIEKTPEQRLTRLCNSVFGRRDAAPRTSGGRVPAAAGPAKNEIGDVCAEDDPGTAQA